MQPNDTIVISKERLRSGKYMSWAAELSEEELYGLFWLLGEFGIRTSKQNLLDSFNERGRARTGLLGVLGFVHGHPLSQEDAMREIRNAFKPATSQQPQD